MASGVEVHVLVLGSAAVGKTSLIKKYVNGGEYSEEYEPTTYELFRKEIKLKSRTFGLNIHDFGGGPGQEAEKESHIKSANGFIVVYDITKKETFDQMKEILQRINTMRNFSVGLPIVLVAAKADLNGTREVLSNYGRAVAREKGCAFFETSVKFEENVQDVFQALITSFKAKGLLIDPLKKFCGCF